MFIFVFELSVFIRDDIFEYFCLICCWFHLWFKRVLAV